MNVRESVEHLLKHYFCLREAFPIKDGQDVAPYWESVAEMRTFQQIELLQKIVDDKKFHHKLPTIFLYEARDLLKTITKEDIRTA